MNSLFEPMTFLRGPSLKSRLTLAPLTNLQSHEDGCLSDDEYKWLTMRAEGGFSLTMTLLTYRRLARAFQGSWGFFLTITSKG